MGFVKNIKEEVHDFGSLHLWIARYLEYFFLWTLLALIVYGVFTYFDLLHTDPDSARYMLSALVQSQAAIVAIVITLSLVAVQLTASTYSPRVIRIFRNNPDMWILLIMYGFSIFYGLLMLKMIPGANDPSQIMILDSSLESDIASVYALGISTFAILCLYMWNIMGLLTSENIINRLTVEITKDNLLNTEDDPIQPVMDIVHGSIMKYDLETTRVGLKAVTDQVIKIIAPDDEEEISERFCAQLTRVGRLAASREDEESIIEVAKNFENFGKSTAKKGLESAAERAAWSLDKVGEASAKKGFEGVTEQAASSLRVVGETAAETGLIDATLAAVVSLGSVGEAAAETGLIDATGNAVGSLEVVGRAAAKTGLEEATGYAVRILGEVGRKAAPGQAALSLGVVGRAAAKTGLERATRQAAESLAELTISSEEIVKTAIQIYESRLKEQDRDSFQKFMKLYEQQLEKLRAEK